MKLCYFDAFSGISGDMTLGALLDAGADWKAVENALRSLELAAEFRVEKTTRHGIAASRFHVEYADQQKARHFAEIESILTSGSISETARKSAIAVFRRLGEAEAKTHHVRFEAVHFHEVGAIDSICDIAGACVALDSLGITEIRSSRVNVGSGTVDTEHGVLPVPTPATTELLKGKPVFSSGPETELTTPTGAALVSTLATGFGPLPNVRVLSQGFGAGDKDFPMQANVLRVLIAEPSYASESTAVDILEANIDDSTPQVLGYAMERLFENGALDVTFTPIFMKKNRPGAQISVVAAPERTERLASIMLAETTTLGLRITRAERRVVARQFAQVHTSYGPVRMKYTETGAFSPEYDDCRKAAEANGVPLRSVIAEANQAFRKNNS
ncbi:MAG: nickel pincer cofactor biosynthesis protein LarC [Acidobacteriaceae bacterium]|nr:nickel pincer cofactor biosynthesis protein LarC [Acidobacteriaceae bacterium]